MLYWDPNAEMSDVRNNRAKDLNDWKLFCNKCVLHKLHTQEENKN